RFRHLPNKNTNQNPRRRLSMRASQAIRAIARPITPATRAITARPVTHRGPVSRARVMRRRPDLNPGQTLSRAETMKPGPAAEITRAGRPKTEEGAAREPIIPALETVALRVGETLVPTAPGMRRAIGVVASAQIAAARARISPANVPYR